MGRIDDKILAFTDTIRLRTNMKDLLVLLFVFAAALISTPAQTEKPKEINWKTPANDLRKFIGEKFTFLCPKDGRISEQLWGTDVYADDSSICTAGAHAGVISPGSGGLVTIDIRRGEDRYKGSKRNGIESYDYGSWMGSFAFVEPDSGRTLGGENSKDPGSGDARGITWSTYSGTLGGKVGDRFSLRCPRGGDLNHRVWGTDVYTNDSSICVAAVHSGLLSLEGGVVTIEVSPGQNKYLGSRRNKVTSEDYGSWNASFIFIKRVE